MRLCYYELVDGSFDEKISHEHDSNYLNIYSLNEWGKQVIEYIKKNNVKAKERWYNPDPNPSF